MLSPRDLPQHDALKAMAQRYPELDVAAVDTCLTLLKTAHDIHAIIDANFAKYDLSAGKFTVLMLLYQADRALIPEEFLTPSECATMAGVTRGTITGLLDGLERQNWLQRQHHPDDKRRQIITLTVNGRQRLEAMLPEHFRLVSAVSQPLTSDEMLTLKDLLFKLHRHRPVIDRPHD
ncbi:MarR family transcriptional regulator [filamentous cyanobacterium LEGE 11480]|uniref:MarR family transcriptional regulator n=1 Tax=Romeriopsis navalis LEGE 11480 TaxID=2777977 RepID=A0A928VNJ1_9CYAN|nr:MarR family transcriptional regulator [Romeriopsis navalis]MBE9029249.1 MarR family transcriptional regulator [Romeriopsis navalis LEGE 11480]